MQGKPEDGNDWNVYREMHEKNVKTLEKIALEMK